MRDMFIELLDARKHKTYKENEFEGLLIKLEKSHEGNTVEWDSGAGEEWAFVNNSGLSLMLNRRIGICFVCGKLDESVMACLSQCKCVFVDGYDIEEWCVDLTDLHTGIPEIVWSATDEAVDPHCFSLNDFYAVTV